MPDTIKLSHYPMTAAWPEVLGLKEGDSIEIHVADRRVFAIEKAPTSKQLLERLRKYRGRLPAAFKFDRLEANERG
jgi:antitoxin MazE